MIDLRVRFDAGLVERAVEGGWDGVLEGWDAGYGRDAPLASLDARQLFPVDRPLGSEDRHRLAAAAADLASRRQRSLERIRTHLPPTPTAVERDLVVALLPFSPHRFGPRPGLQLFGLDPRADAEEAYLFLVHVYYHEISDVSYTERCATCSRVRRGAADFKYWVRLLIRNEGIANHAVLPDLLRLASERPGYACRYFSYADRIGDASALAEGAWLLGRVFEAAEAAEDGAVDRLLAALKGPMTPVVNLLGIHMARSVADRFGLAALTDVFGRDAEEFFRLYERTGARPSLP